LIWPLGVGRKGLPEAGRRLQIGEQINGIADAECSEATGWPDGEIAMAPAA
jgi:hypothetical protein